MVASRRTEPKTPTEQTESVKNPQVCDEASSPTDLKELLLLLLLREEGKFPEETEGAGSMGGGPDDLSPLRTPQLLWQNFVDSVRRSCSDCVPENEMLPWMLNTGGGEGQRRTNAGSKVSINV